jgi:O-antigen ligase
LAAALTFTRSAFIYIPVSIVVMALCIPSGQVRKVLVGSIAALAIILVPLVAVGNIAIFSRFASGDIATLNGRTYLWQAILSHFDPTKLLGNGIMASNALLTYLHIGANGGVIGTSPHALFLGTLYDNGVIGVILLAAAFIALAINLIAGMRKATGEQRLLFAVALAVFTSAVLQSIDSNDFWDPAISLYIWIVIVLPFALYWSEQRQQEAGHDEDDADEPTEPRLRALQPTVRRQATVA